MCVAQLGEEGSEGAKKREVERRGVAWVGLLGEGEWDAVKGWEGKGKWEGGWGEMGMGELRELSSTALVSTIWV